MSCSRSYPLCISCSLWAYAQARKHCLSESILLSTLSARLMRTVLISYFFCQSLFSPAPIDACFTSTLNLAVVEAGLVSATQVPPAPPLIPRLAKTVKDYWFLITLLLSGAASLFYMAVYQVTPLDKYREIRSQRDEANFHNDLGYTLLERGEHELAKTEFENSLSLAPSDRAAVNGRYLAQLFIDAELPQWNAAIGAAVREQLKRLPVIKGRGLEHIVEKYLGDVNARIGNYEIASQHYARALALNPEYIGALFTFGWFHYSQRRDLAKMESLFRKMVELDKYDYRGFHGLGYALYMQAVLAIESDARAKLINEATAQSQEANLLTINILNVVTDFGEIARYTSPGLSLWYHRRGIEIIDDPAAWSHKDNSLPYSANLLLRDGYVYMKSADQKRAWVIYSLALDHLALSRLGVESERNRRQHDELKRRAARLDPRKDERGAAEVYQDQLAILDKFVPI